MNDNTIIPGRTVVIDEAGLAKLIMGGVRDMQATQRELTYESLAQYLQIPSYYLTRTLKFVDHDGSRSSRS